MKATTRIVLPHFADAGKPFAMLFWCAIPTSPSTTPPTASANMSPASTAPRRWPRTRDADSQLGALLAALKEQGLDKTTDVFVTADHGFLTISHASATSPSAHCDPDAPLIDLPHGFLAVDLASALRMRLFDPAKASPAWIMAAAASCRAASA